MRQAIQDILEDVGLEQLERIPVDYDELQEKAEEVEAEILQEARSQRKRVPVISDHTESEAGGEYKPLAKVEELEEANYNMIDNVLNNMPPKKEPYLEYYAAECDEYHSLGNIYKSKAPESEHRHIACFGGHTRH